MVKTRKKYKNYTLTFRVSEKDYFELLQLSEKNQMNISEILRDALRSYLKKKF